MKWLLKEMVPLVIIYLLVWRSDPAVLRTYSWQGLRDHMWCQDRTYVNHMHGKCLACCTVSPAKEVVPLEEEFCNPSGDSV